MEEFLQVLERTVPALYVMQTPWVWPVLEIVHFVGLSLLFGIVALVDLRLMGRFKALPFNFLQDMVPLAFLGFGLNTASGALFLIANPTQYFYNWLFWLKMFFVAGAGLNVVAYRMVARRHASSGDGQNIEESSAGRRIGALSLLLWLGVILAGRMLPFLGGD